jgi:hypothetical protein
MDQFEYNTQRSYLLLKEYGRNVQKLAEHLCTIPNQEERTALAHVLINLMKQLNPSVRESMDSPQRIWDHLQVMADFQLDIDGPYPKPDRAELYKKPKRMSYVNNEITYRHYGRNVELLVAQAIAIEDPTERQQAALYLFRLMRTFYTTWNKEHVEDVLILKHLRELSNNQLQLTPDEVRNEGSLAEPSARDPRERPERGEQRHQNKYGKHNNSNNNNNKYGKHKRRK